MTNLAQPNDDGIFLEVVPFSRGDLYGEHSQNSLDVCRVDGYLKPGVIVRKFSNQEETRLGFPHDFSVFANPDNQHELFSLRFLVVGVAHTSVSKRTLGVVQKLAKLIQAAGTRLGEN